MNLNGGKEKLPELALTLPGAKLELLTMASKNPQGVLLVPLEGYPSPMHAKALTDIVIGGHIQLIDVCLSLQMTKTTTGNRPESVPTRVFKITPEGRRELAMLMVSAT